MSLFKFHAPLMVVATASILSLAGHAALLVKLSHSMVSPAQPKASIDHALSFRFAVRKATVDETTTKQPPAPMTRLGRERVKTSSAAVFFSESQLARPPLVSSAPSLEQLNDVVVSGLPIRLRLFINETGTVVRIETIQASPDDQAVVERIKSVFYATAFMAGERKDLAVPSYKDIEIFPNAVQH